MGNGELRIWGGCQVPLAESGGNRNPSDSHLPPDTIGVIPKAYSKTGFRNPITALTVLE
jgi:hypothetical protein